MASDKKIIEEVGESSHDTPQAITITIMDPSALEATDLDSSLVTSVETQDDSHDTSTLLVVPGDGHASISVEHGAKNILQTVTETHMGTHELPVISNISNPEEDTREQDSIHVTTKTSEIIDEGEGVDEEDGEEADESVGQHCLICNIDLPSEQSTEPVLVFKTQTTTTQRKMSVFLGALIGQKLTSRKAHSDIMCHRCFGLLDRVDALEVEIRDTKEEIVNKYQETVAVYGGRARRRKPATAKKTDYVFPKVEPEDEDEQVLGLEMDENFEPRVEDLMEEENDHREDRSTQDEEWEPEFKKPRIKREAVDAESSGPTKRKRGRPRKDAAKPKDLSLSPGLMSVEEMQLTVKVDGDAGRKDFPVRSTDRQQMLSAHTITDIPNLHKLDIELRMEDLTCACGVKSNSKIEHVEHVLTHMTGAFRCPQCQCSYTCSSRLACHQRLMHSGDAPKERIPEIVKSASTSGIGDIICSKCDEPVGGDIHEHTKIHLYGENECPACAVRLKTSYAMEMHMERKHPHLLQAFLKSEDSLKERPEDDESTSQPVRCDVCSKVVATASKLARHRYLQHPEHYPWACPDCNLTFPSHHTRENHTCPYRRKGDAVLSVGGQKNECCICRLVCKSKLSLERHMRRVHPIEGTGPHTCPVCARILVSRKALTDHLRCHRRQQGFSCEFCNAQLKTMDSLNVHVNEIHTHVVRLQCKHCPQVFFSSGRLSYHIKRHHTDRRSYTNLCHLCGKAYPYPSELKLHLRSHRNERPYKCNQCQKTFLKQGDLTYHKRSHTGERPHKCPHCDARFPRPNTLMSHIRQQHRERTDADTSEILDVPSTIISEVPVSSSPIPSYVTSAPATIVAASSASYLATVNPSATMQPPPPAVTVMSVAGAVPQAPGEATLVPVVEGRLVDGQLVDAVVDGQVTEMQPVQYVQVDSLSASQTVQAVPHTVEGMEYDEAASVPYQIVHLQILQ